MKKHEEYISFDTETTGFSFNKGDKIVEIGAVKIINGEVVDTFQRYIDPQRNIPYQVIRVHGITNEKVKGMPLFCDIVEEFLDFAGNGVYIAHNARFDVDFVGNEIYDSIKKGNLNKSLFERFTSSKIIDTMAYSKKTFKKGRHNLNALSERLGIDHSHRDFHGALLDADLLGQVFMSINGGNQLSLISESDSFDIVEVNSYLGSLKLKEQSKVIYKERKMLDLTDKEKSAHRSIMERIEKESGKKSIGGIDTWTSIMSLEQNDRIKPIKEKEREVQENKIEKVIKTDKSKSSKITPNFCL